MGAHGSPAAVGAAQRSPDHQVEGDQLDDAVGLTTGGTRIQDGGGTFEDECLQEEGGGDQDGVGGRRGQGLQGTGEHGVELDVGVALLGDLVGDLEQGHPGREAGEVLSDGSERI